MAVFFTSDTHFGDHRVLNIHGRPFASVAEMDATLLARWNETVAPADDVWHVGDFARTAARAAELLPQLHGRKHLIRGNNDPDSVAADPGWASVQDYREIDCGGTLLVLCHYPFRSWNGQHRKSVNLHGHSHGRLKPMLRQFDVGVDAWDFRPVTFETILEGRPGTVEIRHG